MRLWNLMTAKKAGVLNFDRELLAQVGEGKFSSGEGRKVVWAEDGESYVVGFERGAAVFGIDSKPRAVIRPAPATKLHQIRLVPSTEGSESSLLAVSTEDGRVLFYDIAAIEGAEDTSKLPQSRCITQLGGPAAGIGGRVKDFEIVKIAEDLPLLLVTASSDGAIRLWAVEHDDLKDETPPSDERKQVGRLVAVQETGERITCLGVFPLDGKSTDDEDDDGEEFEGFDGAEENPDEESDDDE